MTYAQEQSKTYRVLSIGAHPDDADTSAGGLLWKLKEKGWEVRLLSLTDGSAGMYDVHRCGPQLAAIRTEEASRSGALLGGRYDVWDIPDARLTASIENRERLIRYIREFRPDLIVTNRPGDYHPDHRNTAILVVDASYLLTVPAVCADTKAMETMPVILYWLDSFQRPYPCQPDVIVPIDDYEEKILQLACCHESQYFDWLLWPDRMDHREWPREKQIEELRTRYRASARRYRSKVAKQLEEHLGELQAAKIEAVEYYEICEFGEPLSDELRRILEE